MPRYILQMAANNRGRQPGESTRGRVVGLLRLKSRTVDDIARELRLTDNAIRTHLAGLARDGIVRQEGVRRGVGAGKPASIFGIAPGADAGFSSAYVPVLLALLEELAERQDADAMNELMRGVGRRLAAPLGTSGDRSARLKAAVVLLRQLGALVDVTEANGQVTICGHGCVVGLAVSDHPAMCRAMATLLAEMIGEEVHELCDRAGRPSCRFQVGRSGMESEKTAQSLP